LNKIIYIFFISLLSFCDPPSNAKAKEGAEKDEFPEMILLDKLKENDKKLSPPVVGQWLY
jgi:hypothetical protein